ncbi:MAG TPA: NAD(P)H-dependent oxidoreductase subunit E [Firmicutes bacterium]|nr:NAD(P)H-dependent oxidoreductase subunit E [Bacillota bacterium]
MTLTAHEISDKIDRICEKYPHDESSLIEVLHDISAEFRWLPADALRHASEILGVPLAKVYAVATFYKGFSLEPRGEKIIRVCKGTACHVRGADRNIDELKRLIGVEPGETTDDLKFTLEVVNCVGACAMAPVVVVNDKYYRNASPNTMKSIITGEEIDESDEGGDD